jgi:hypothetical protein
MYTKQTMGFALAGLALWVLVSELPNRRRELWRGAVIAVVGLIPLALLTWKLGQFNVQQAAGLSDSLRVWSLPGLTWYLRHLADMTGWPLLAALGLGLILLGAKRPTLPSLERWEVGAQVTAFVVALVLFTAIAHKSQRFALPLLVPVVAITFILLARGLGPRATIVIGLAILGFNVFVSEVVKPAPFLRGFDPLLREVIRSAPPDSSIIYAAHDESPLIFGLRAAGSRPDLSVVRLDKILFRIKVTRSAGVEEMAVGKAALLDTFRRLRVARFVVQPGFWGDLKNMQMFTQLLGDPEFRAVGRFPLQSNYPHPTRELMLYEYTGPMAEKKAKPEYRLDIVDIVIAPDR